MVGDKRCMVGGPGLHQGGSEEGNELRRRFGCVVLTGTWRGAEFLRVREGVVSLSVLPGFSCR